MNAKKIYREIEMDFRTLAGSCSIAIVLHVRARTYVYPPLTNFYFRLTLKPFISVWKGTMGARAELQVNAFSTNTGNVVMCFKVTGMLGPPVRYKFLLLASYRYHW